MTRRAFSLGALLLVLILSPLAAATAPAATGSNATDANPGSAASSTIAVQGAAIEQTVQTEAFTARVAAAETPAGRAEAVADALARLETRVETLEGRLRTLEAARANESLGTATYEARTARIAASARIQQAVLQRAQEAAAELDAETVREANVTTDRFETVRSRIDRLVAVDTTTATGQLGSSFYRGIRTVATKYNENVAAENLGVLGTYLDGERVNLHILRRDGETAVVSFRTTETTRVRDLQAGPHPDATVRIRVDESTARRLLDSDRPAQAANQAFLNDEITITGLGIYNTIKWGITSAVVFLVRLIVGLVGFLLGLLP